MYDWDARLDHWNAKKNVTDVEVADALGIDASNLSHWRAERNNPSTATMARLAAFYGVDLSAFLAPLPKKRAAR